MMGLVGEGVMRRREIRKGWTFRTTVFVSELEHTLASWAYALHKVRVYIEQVALDLDERTRQCWTLPLLLVIR